MQLCALGFVIARRHLQKKRRGESKITARLEAGCGDLCGREVWYRQLTTAEIAFFLILFLQVGKWGFCDELAVNVLWFAAKWFGGRNKNGKEALDFASFFMCASTESRNEHDFQSAKTRIIAECRQAQNQI